MVDPDFRNLLEMWKSIDLDIDSVDPELLRKFMDESSLSSRGKKIDLKTVEDIVIPLPAREIKGRIYDDSDSESAIIFYHGGGFVFGNVDTYDNLCRLIARESKMKIISINYRLAPENKFPAALDDAFDTFHYIHEHRNKVSIRDKLGVAGDSAGANLAASLSIKSRDENLPMPDVQVLLYPSLAPDNFSRSFMEFSEGYGLTGKFIEYFGKQYMARFEDVLNPYFSPLVSESFKNLPPTILVANEYDPLRDPAETFYKKLRKDGVKAIGIRSLGMVHGFATNFEISETAKNNVVMVSKMIREMM